MNKVILLGRLVRDPETRYGGANDSMAVCRYTLAVDKKFKKDGEATADFINCISFGKTAEFAEKYFTKGLRAAVSGRIQTGSYTNRDGQKIYTTDVVVEEHEIAQSRSEASSQQESNRQPEISPYGKDKDNGFMNIPDGIDDELPFS